MGLQEAWLLSVCLFHVKFGGPCREVDFFDTRPGLSNDTSSEYDTSELNGWVDELDRPVYAEAQKMFYDDVLRFGVSHESCSGCYRDAGLRA